MLRYLFPLHCSSPSLGSLLGFRYKRETVLGVRPVSSHQITSPSLIFPSLYSVANPQNPSPVPGSSSQRDLVLSHSRPSSPSHTLTSHFPFTFHLPSHSLVPSKVLFSHLPTVLSRTTSTSIVRVTLIVLSIPSIPSIPTESSLHEAPFRLGGFHRPFR